MTDEFDTQQRTSAGPAMRRTPLANIAVTILVGAAIGLGSAMLFEPWWAAPDPHRAAVESLMAEAEAHESAARLEEAIAALQALLSLEPGDERTRARLAALRQRRDEQQRRVETLLKRAEQHEQDRKSTGAHHIAVSALEELLTLKPDHDPARMLLEDLNRRSGPRLLHTIEGYDGGRATSLSPDGRWIASGLRRGSVGIWDAQTGKLVHKLRGHRGVILVASFGPHGRRVVSAASSDRTLCIWDVQAGTLLHELEGHEAQIAAASFSPDGRWIASNSRDSEVIIWDAQTGQRHDTLEEQVEGKDPYADQFWGAAFSPDGELLVTGSADHANDHTVRVWTVASGELVHALGGHKDRIVGVAFTPDGQCIISRSVDKTVRLWGASTGEMLYTHRHPLDWPHVVSCSPNGRWMVSGSRNLWIWEMETGALRHTLKETRWTTTLAFSPDGHRFLTGSTDHNLRVWNSETATLLHTLDGHEENIHTASFYPDGDRIVSSSRDGTIRIWSLRDGKDGTP